MRTMSRTNIVVAILIITNCLLFLKDPSNNSIENLIKKYATSTTPEPGNYATIHNCNSTTKNDKHNGHFTARSYNTANLIKAGSFLENSIRKARNKSLNFNKLIDIDFKYLTNPECRRNLLLIVVVSSKPDNFDKRKSIRRTWGRSSYDMQVVFTLGTWDDTALNVSIMYKTRREIKLHGDIIQGNFVDSYRNLTYKHMMGLQWVTEHCTSPRFLLKTDDDVFVNYKELIWFLNREFYDWGNRNAMACALQTGIPVVRNKTDFWFVTMEEYADEFYPPFCSGSFILYAPEILPLLIQESSATKYFYVDDVYVTGLLARKLGLTHINLDYLFLNKQKLHLLLQGGPGHAGVFITGPENVDVKTVYVLWWIVTKYYEDNKLFTV